MPPSGRTESAKQASTRDVRIFIRPQVRRKIEEKVWPPTRPVRTLGCWDVGSFAFLHPNMPTSQPGGRGLSPFLAAGARLPGILPALRLRAVDLAAGTCLFEFRHESRRFIDELIECCDRFRGRLAQLINMLTILPGARGGFVHSRAK